MTRFQTKYLCRECGYETPKWLGKCPECGGWDSFEEEVTLREKDGSSRSGRTQSSNFRELVSTGQGSPQPITEVEMAAIPRLSTGIGEFDRSLGGGIVPGGVTLVGGDPGIGKSTLLTQAAYNLAFGKGNQQAADVLYISGEESPQQIRLRCSRLGAETERFLVSVETEIGLIVRYIEAGKPSLVIIDSIQTMYDSSLDSAPGTLSQVRATAAHLARYAKSSHTPIVLIGHVTKDGNLAGPKVLEHLVDTVLYFEGDTQNLYRMLRAVKNRFGSTNELGIFQMEENGLIGVENPSAALLAERVIDGTGSAVTSTMEGSRALLVETQALAAKSALVSPRRVVTGLDPNRINMILATMEKRLGMRLAEQDVFVNVAGGVRVMETAADLAVAMATASSFRDQPVEPTTIILGEVGLAGEVRAVPHAEKRLREAARQGFRRAILSRHNTNRLPVIPDIEIIPVSNLLDAIQFSLLPPKK